MITTRRRNIRMAATLLFVFIIAAAALFNTAVAWTNDEQLTGLSGEPEGWDMKPTVVQTRDGKLWVFFSSDMLEGQREIFYKTSSDNGTTWSAAKRFTWDDDLDDIPHAIQSWNGTLWVFWSSWRTGNYDIFYKTSIDLESEWWQWDCVQLTNDSRHDSFPCATQNIDGTIVVVWQREVAVGDYRLYIKTSCDDGMTWSSETCLTENSWDINPSVTWTYNGTLWLVWAYYNQTGGQYDLLYKTTSDNGFSWSDTHRLTTDPSWDIAPSVLQAPDGQIWVFWSTDRIATDKYAIHYKTYNMSAMTWSPPTLLTKSSGSEENPKAIVAQDRKIWVVWHSTKTEYDIYYTISDEISPVHDVAISGITTWVPRGLNRHWVPKGMPVYINVTVENQGTSVESFNVTAYADRNIGDIHVLIGTQEITLAGDATTTLNFLWDTKDSSYGSYYLSANATIVSGEYDTADNILLHGARVGGICVPWQPQATVLAVLNHVVSAILIMVVLGITAIAFFKILMSVRPQLPSRLLHTSQRA